tara:strand:- start:64545 stop:64922 length:378 start_codon:yes stop_codon:yes gene_type:complete
MTKLFFIDDEPILLKLCQLFLARMENLEITYFESAIDALTEIEKGNIPNLIISDIKMPKMSGFELAKTLINKSYINKIKFSYCTSFASLQDASDVYSLERKDLLDFPFYNKPIGKDIIDFIEKQL